MRIVTTLEHLTKKQLLEVSRTLALYFPQHEVAAAWSKAQIIDELTEFATDDLLEAMNQKHLRRILEKLGRPSSELMAEQLSRLKQHIDSPTSEYDEYHKQFSYDPEIANRQPRPYQLDALRALRAKVSPATPSKIVMQLATGGGKTFVANNFVEQWLKQHGGYVLWLTKDWWLLRQAAQDRGRRFESAKGRLLRLGGAGTALSDLTELPGNVPPQGSVLYSTLHTYKNRRGLRQPSLVIWDESHWAEMASLGQHLVKKMSQKPPVPIVGLTATPRKHTDFELVFEKVFVQLINDGHLAKPELEVVPTGIQWTPELTQSQSLIEPASLRRLARSSKRNKQIIDCYLNNRARYGKTLAFACNIKHANDLARLAAMRGITVGAIHSQMHRDDIAGTKEDFIEGRIELLVNVDKMTHGVDIPAIQTVFLCRPTTSDILYSQMVGRGARLHAETNKTSFNLVEFADNVQKHADVLQSAKVFFNGSTDVALSGDERAPVAWYNRGAAHHFDPTGMLRLASDEARRKRPYLAGVAFRAGQTFGLELEFTAPEFPGTITRAWRARAASLLTSVREATPGHVAAEPRIYHAKDHTQWNVEHDSSAGWELVSRVLTEEDGLTEFCDVVEAVDRSVTDIGLRVNYQTGLHVHIGWQTPGEDRTSKANRVWRLLRWAHYLEPALASILPPSRVIDFSNGSYDLSQPNEYCLPVSHYYGAALQARECPSWTKLCQLEAAKDSRYSWVNVGHLMRDNGLGTVEFRLHSGTSDVRKVAHWLSICVCLLWLADHEEFEPPRLQDGENRTVILPTDDLVDRIEEHFPQAVAPALAQWVRDRRRDVARLWYQRATLRQAWTLPWYHLNA